MLRRTVLKKIKNYPGLNRVLCVDLAELAVQFLLKSTIL